MKYIDDYDKRLKRHDAFWANEMDGRCCLSVTAPRGGYTVEAIPADPAAALDYWTNAERAFKRYVYEMENTYFAGDSLPIANFNLGAAGHAGFFRGAKYEFKDSLWFFPSIDDIVEAPPVFDETSFLYKKSIEMADYFAGECKGDFLISNTDSCGCVDALTHLYGSGNLMMDMMDPGRKESIHAALQAIQSCWERTTFEMLDILKRNNRGMSCIGWLKTCARGNHGQVQCDISVMLSKEHFDEFCLPELETQSGLFDYALYHLDGKEQARHLDSILAVDGIKAIQWTDVTGQPSPLEFIPILKRIQAAGKQLVIRLKPCELEEMLANLSAKGLFLKIVAASKDEADKLVSVADALSRE